MNDINEMPPKCQYCPYWEVCKFPWVCPDIGDNKPDLQPTYNQLENDCISRHGVSAWLDNMGYPRLADIVMDEKRFPSAQPEQRWVPCSEKLPENGYWLWSAKGGEVQKDFYWDGHWEHAEKYGYEVMAWMPLPEPPKEDDNDHT